MSRQAVILAGGRGTRLRARLNGRPKPLVDIEGTPLLGRQIAILRSGGFTDILILVNYAAEQIEAFCANPDFADLSLKLLDDGRPRGTAGALLQAFPHLHSRFLVVYGDTLFDVDLAQFWRAHEMAQADATLFLHPNDHPADSDLAEVDERSAITAFYNPPHDPEACLPNLVNAALYVLEQSAIAFWLERDEPTDIARDLFPTMLRRGAKLQGYTSFEYIKDIGTPARLDRAIRDLRAGVLKRARRDQPQKAVFLDRDGTINELRGHIARPEDLVLIEGAAEAVKRLNEAEFRVVLVTNQPVIARGETDTAGLRRIHNRLETLLGRSGAYLDAIYYCPHHPDKGFPGEVEALKIVCNCRKPSTGLIERAVLEINIDRDRSWFIGDSTQDVLTAKRVGLESILVQTGEAGRDGKYAVDPDFVLKDIGAAVHFITRSYAMLCQRAAAIARSIDAGSLVLIGGLARQGKSTFAAALCREIIRAGKASRILTLDGFLWNQSERQPGVLGRYDLDAARAALAQWLDGREVCIEAPIYNRLTRGRDPGFHRLDLALDSVLIVEGVPGLLLDPVTHRPVLRIFVGGQENARRRRVVDDLIARGLETETAEDVYFQRNGDEAPVIEVSAASADIVLSLDDVLAGSRS